MSLCESIRTQFRMNAHKDIIVVFDGHINKIDPTCQ